MTKKEEKEVKIFNCELCHFICYKKFNYDKHLNTRKHINNNISLHKKSEIEQIQKYKCGCGKEYNHRQGLHTHKKKCKLNEDTIPQVEIINDPSNNVIKLLINENKELINENKDFKNLILEMMKSNNELQQKMFELCKNNNNNTTINNNTNSHNINNKTFNLQVFLNEECKDAMNMTEFINSIQLKLSDLENIGNQGYIEGVSNIIINHLHISIALRGFTIHAFRIFFFPFV